MKHGHFLLLSLCLLTACAPTIHARLTTFNEDEYKSYAGEGTSIIYGDAFLKTRSGDVKKGAGNPVHLNPVTAYSTEWFERAIQGGQILAEPDTRAIPYHRVTTADSDGRFEFDKLPPGEYYLACPIFWEVPAGYGNMIKTGGWAYGRVKVLPGEKKKVILTQ